MGRLSAKREWIGRLSGLAAATALALTASLAPDSAAAEPEYCMVNHTKMPLHFHFKRLEQGLLRKEYRTHRVKTSPGRQACCRGTCTRDVRVGVDMNQSPGADVQAAKYGLKALAFLLKVKPVPGQPVIQEDKFRSFCQAQMTRGDRIEVLPLGGAVRCDIVAKAAYTRYSTGARGRVETPQNGFRVCNRARSATLNFTYGGSFRGKPWESTGWFSVKPGACRTLVLDYGYRGKAYWRARRGDLKWSGPFQLCVNPNKAFTNSRADGRCPSGQVKQGFREATFALGRNVTLNFD